MARSKFRAGDRERAKEMFRRLPKSVRRETSSALDEAAIELSQAIERAVPIDEGDLKESVGWARGAPGGKKRRAGDDADLTVRVFEGNDKTFYAPFVEFNGRAHFFPTYRANRKRLAARIKRRQRKAIKEAGHV